MKAQNVRGAKIVQRKALSQEFVSRGRASSVFERGGKGEPNDGTDREKDREKGKGGYVKKRAQKGTAGEKRHCGRIIIICRRPGVSLIQIYARRKMEERSEGGETKRMMIQER